MLCLKTCEDKNRESKPNPVQLVHNPVCELLPKQEVEPKINPLFNTHWCKATLSRPDGTNKQLCLLRDSGSLQSLLSRAHIDEKDYTETGEYRLIQGLGGEVIRIPLVTIKLDSKYGNGVFLFGLVDCLPDKSFDGLIGNDLDPPSELVEENLVVNVVTRSQSAAQHSLTTASKPSDIVTPDNGNNGSSGNKGNNGKSAQSTTQNDKDDVDNGLLCVDISSLFSEDNTDRVSKTISSVTSRDELIKLQQDDQSLASLFQLVQPVTNELNGQPLFFLDHGVLMRAWRDKQSPMLAGTEYRQIVVPSALRTAILQVAHDIPAAAHLGMTKTKNRVEPHFYWPSMSQDIKNYIRTCDVCQRLGKGGKPSPASLHNLPTVAEPFQRIAIDIVGPLPTCSETGNRFILTIIDHGTHFPEAIPLVKHEAPDVARALISVFARFGFPREILSDCGSEFMSTLMSIFLKEFGIQRIRTSPYHPCTNGSCERLNGSMKSMIRALTDEFPNSWDQTLPWIMFAYREVPVETLGFSPFELLFARHVPGPLSLIKDSWLNESQYVSTPLKSVVAFVLDMRQRLRLAIEQANVHAVNEKSKSKKWYDKKARDRSFQPGDEILALLPLQNSLQAKYCGPYRVLEKLGPVDYVIDTPNRKKTKRVCHVNLLKAYHRRDEKLFPRPSPDCLPTCMVEVSDTSSADFGSTIPAFGDLKQTTLLDPKPSLLSETQQVELTNLLSSFDTIFCDIPGQTTLINHHIDLMPNSRPVTCAPYRLHPEKAKMVEKEIDEMLKLNIIERSSSPWASPIVLVPKPDGSIRLCTDYRRVNTLTVADPFPFPRIEDLVDKVGHAHFLTKVDMTRGYWQVPLDEDSVPVSAFVTPSGHFQWRFLPYGLKGAPTTFSRLATNLLTRS